MAREPHPPRPIGPGDVVATYCDPLGQWSAAQITDLNPAWGTAGVLDLDWCGPEPSELGQLGELAPLVKTHDGWAGQWEHVNYEWLLPRNYKLLGRAPVLARYPSNAYSAIWKVGEALADQRRWDRGEQDAPAGRLSCRGAEVGSEPANSTVWDLTVTAIDSLDCADLVVRYPELTVLSLQGEFATLSNAVALNDLPRLRTLFISDLFGMSAVDCLRPHAATRMENIGLYNVPRDYAHAMRGRWRGERSKGTALEIRGARDPEWIAENRDNPLRNWDTRPHVSPGRYRKSVRLYRDTRRAVLAALETLDGDDLLTRLGQLGRDYAEGFNQLNGTRAPFIETEEREDLLAALIDIVNAADSTRAPLSRPATIALLDAAEAARTW
jgi:hypothetical protein